MFLIKWTENVDSTYFCMCYCSVAALLRNGTAVKRVHIIMNKDL